MELCIHHPMTQEIEMLVVFPASENVKTLIFKHGNSNPAMVVLGLLRPIKANIKLTINSFNINSA